MADVVSHERRQELARLLHERRWKPPELAQRFGCSVRTVQRDLELFGDEMGEPVPMDDAGYYLNPGMHPVPSVSLTTHEARALLFAMRLFLRNADELDEDGLSLLGKLGAAFPGVMANYAHLTADELRQRPQNPPEPPAPGGGRNAVAVHEKCRHRWEQPELSPSAPADDVRGSAFL